jgi:membrane peptidoglycan carboxypeptidase
LEIALPKARIFEIYLNVIEWGDQVWGAEAAARMYFGVSAAGLSREQAALLAGAIRNPHIYNPARPRRGLLTLQQRILALMGGVEPPAPVPSPVPTPTAEEAETSLGVPEPTFPEPPEGDEPVTPNPPPSEAPPPPETEVPR